MPPIATVAEFAPNEGEGTSGVFSLAVNALRRVEVRQSDIISPELRVPTKPDAGASPRVALRTVDTNFQGRGFYRRAITEGNPQLPIVNPVDSMPGIDGLLELEPWRFVAIPDVIPVAPMPQFGRRYAVFMVPFWALAAPVDTTLCGIRFSAGAEAADFFVEARLVALPGRGYFLQLGQGLVGRPMTFNSYQAFQLSESQVSDLSNNEFVRLDVYRTSSGFWASVSTDLETVFAGLTSSGTPQLGPVGSLPAAVTRLDAISAVGAEVTESDHTSCIAFGSSAVPLTRLQVGPTTMSGSLWGRCYDRQTPRVQIEWSGVEQTAYAGTIDATGLWASK